jgi:hypothetical protein
MVRFRVFLDQYAGISIEENASKLKPTRKVSKRGAKRNK